MPARDSQCPMCGNIPEPECFPPDSNPFVWNGMLQMYICDFCNLELAIEFYQEESRYFDTAAKMLEVSVWESRKRYLEDLIACATIMLVEEQEENQIIELNRRVRDCQRHRDAIECFITVESRSDDEQELNHAWQELRKALAEPAFGAEVALPDLLTIQID